MAHLPSLADDCSLIDVYRRFPAIADAALALNEAVMRHPAPFSPAEREAIAAYVSTLNRCAYCRGIHAHAAAGLGMADETVTGLCERPEAPADSRLRPVLAYVARLTAEPAAVGRDDVQAILEAGWTRRRFPTRPSSPPSMPS